MKKIIKLFYMFCFHPILFFRFTIKKDSLHFFIKRQADLKKCKKIKMGKNITFGSNTRINFFDNQQLKQLEIGDNCYICNRVSFLVGDKILLENDVLIASDVCIVSENHGTNPIDMKPYMAQPLLFHPIEIREGCWIGEKSVILPGVTIGKKSIIGAGSVVTKDIPSYCIAAGNPAKVIKRYNFKTYQWERE